MRSKRWFVAVAACAAQTVLGTACMDVGVVPEVPEEGGDGRFGWPAGFVGRAALPRS